MLIPNYDISLVAASIAVSVIASYTGLLLTSHISRLSEGRRKLMIVMGAFALGGGIWSMHFVAMLAMRFPVPVSYDALATLGSALIAVLMCGIGFLILHYGGRSWLHLAAAGAIIGNGIVIMHYLGVSAIDGCMPMFSPMGIVATIVAATAMGVISVVLAYGRRTDRRILAGAVSLGLSVVVVHFVAMAWTEFERGASAGAVSPVIQLGTLALLVMLSAFVICGSFLLTATQLVGSGVQDEPSDEPTHSLGDGVGWAFAAGSAGTDRAVRFIAPAEPPAKPVDRGSPHGAAERSAADTATGDHLSAPASPSPDVAPAAAISPTFRLPYESDKRTYFLAPDEVAAVRADGHYSVLYTKQGKHFCPLSISAVLSRAPGGVFQRTHRSYLVNLSAVSGFERQKDSGRCLLKGIDALPAAPVSRNYLPEVREALGL